MKTYLWWRLLWTDIVPRRVKILTNESEKERWFSQDTLYKQTSDTRLELDERKHFTRSKESNIKTNIKQPSERWMTHISVPCQMNSRIWHHHEWLMHNDSKQAPKGTTCPKGRPSTGWRGNHDMLTTLRSICPTCGGSSTARECGTAAKALYTCLILMGYSSCVSGDGARGCTRGRGRRGGRVEKQTKDKKDGTANERQSS